MAGVPDTRPIAPVGWSLSAVARIDDGWELRVSVCSTHADGQVRVALVGRDSGQELLAATELQDDDITCVVPVEALRWFGPEALDAWIDVTRGTGKRERHRIGVPERLRGSAIKDVSESGVRLYATVHGNLSFELAVPVAHPDVPAGPVVTTIDVAGSRVRLTMTNPHAPVADASITLLARRSGSEVSLPLWVEPSSYAFEVNEGALGGAGNQPIDVFWAVAAGGSSWVRGRIGCPDPVAPAMWGLREWYATSSQHLALRRQTPATAIRRAGVFDANYYLGQVGALPADVDLIEHYLTVGDAKGIQPSSIFDGAFYREMNPSTGDRNPLAHYCEFGWKDLLNPSPEFDTWWYWSKHLDPADMTVNPLAHYLSVGRSQGLSTVPNPHPVRSFGPGQALPPHGRIRRVCLFAGYDPHGIVDDYVVDYVRELARHADVYYLADSEISGAELAKLEGAAKRAWSLRHGEYDFGSYARLADLVGWETIETYDELLLVNDSSYLLGPLDDVFDRMRNRSCNWWGLQATKGIMQTRDAESNLFREPIPMREVRAHLLDRFETDYRYDFHIGSYFLGFRNPVTQDPEFRRYLSAVGPQDKKRRIILKHEVGLTHWLIQHGHPFDTFSDWLYPFHPIFTSWYFQLLGEGFPLLKRYFLAENHYQVPALARWPELVRARAPEARVDVFEKNLARVTDPAKLHQSLHVQAPVDDPGAGD